MEAAGAGIFAGFALMWLFFGLIGIGLTVFWIWMLVDCIQKEPAQGNDRLIWVLVIVLVGWIGALIYLLARRPQRIQMYGK
jgi:hypothetical protein